ncbi:hypothetical protein SEA_SPILLED_125 [Streptomyces phage Spilled]|nr:hypothetical protein SEA_SPILLED_125 [Streptomyces phage Spilled]
MTRLSRPLSRCHEFCNVTVSPVVICHFVICHGAAGRCRGVTSLRFSIYLRDARRELTERNRPVKVNYTGKRKEKE